MTLEEDWHATKRTGLIHVVRVQGENLDMNVLNL